MSTPEEKNLTSCKVCNQLKLRIQDGKFDAKNKRWRDDKGSLWIGKVCPDCHRDRMATYQKNKRNGNV